MDGLTSHEWMLMGSLWRASGEPVEPYQPNDESRICNDDSVTRLRGQPMGPGKKRLKKYVLDPRGLPKTSKQTA